MTEPMNRLTDAELRIFKAFLHSFLESLTYRTCNDLELDNTPENYRMLQRIIKWNCGNEDDAKRDLDDLEEERNDQEVLITNDALVLHYLIDKLGLGKE